MTLIPTHSNGWIKIRFSGAIESQPRVKADKYLRQSWVWSKNMKNVVLSWFWPTLNFVQPRIDQGYFGQVDLKRHFKCFYALTCYTVSIYMYPQSPGEKLMGFWNFQGLACKSRVEKIRYLQAAMWWCSSKASHNLSLLHEVWLFRFFLDFWSDLYETI